MGKTLWLSLGLLIGGAKLKNVMLVTETEKPICDFQNVRWLLHQLFTGHSGALQLAPAAAGPPLRRHVCGPGIIQSEFDPGWRNTCNLTFFSETRERKVSEWQEVGSPEHTYIWLIYGTQNWGNENIYMIDLRYPKSRKLGCQKSDGFVKPKSDGFQNSKSDGFDLGSVTFWNQDFKIQKVTDST